MHTMLHIYKHKYKYSTSFKRDEYSLVVIILKVDNNCTVKITLTVQLKNYCANLLHIDFILS